MDAKERPDVVAGKYDPALFDPTGRTLLVNEVFYSLQGEGFFTGCATVFIRFAKCNLACKFCDTEFETYQLGTVDEVVERVLKLVPATKLGEPAEHQVLRPRIDLTGGEPMLQNLGPLVLRLQALGFEVGMETSGSVNAPVGHWAHDLDWITCSPKLRKQSMPQGLTNIVDEYKWIVNAAFLNLYQQQPNDMWFPGTRNYLQPESNNPKFISAATKLILQYPERYMLSLQMHKVAGLP